MLRYFFPFLFFIIICFILCFALTSPPLMLCIYLQTFEAALFLEEEEEKEYFPFILLMDHAMH